MKWVIDYLYPRNFDHKSIPSLDDKVIVVTGGCSGLGYEIATQCAIHNAKRLIIVSLPSRRLDDAVRSLTEKLTNAKGKLFLGNESNVQGKLMLLVSISRT
jgi:NAD(P)-dependent dehydrogenase (short-subunit alcohol dehydrogenase family)